MELTFECPGCHAIDRVSSAESAGMAICRGCGRERPLRAGSCDDGGLCSCTVCATTDLYLQKDFPQGLGLAIVVLGFAVSTVFWYYDMPAPALGVLLISALVDMVLYYLVPDVTICYRCLSQHRGPGSNPEGRFRPFDLAVGERYRQERIRAEELRGRGSSIDPGAPVA